MEALTKKLVDYWRSARLEISNGNSEEDVREFELRRGVALPADFRSYLLTVNGMAQLGGRGCDSEGFSFWPLNCLVSVSDELAKYGENWREPHNADELFVFADYLQLSWEYAIRLTSDPTKKNVIVSVRTAKPKIVAPSFTDFVELYLKDSKELYPD